MPQYYLLFAFLLMFTNARSQQCSVNPNIDIPDNGKSYSVKLEANTTNSGSRLLCGVRLSFEHQFVDELKFEIISPSGKKITLIAGKAASSNTEGSVWSILFVRQSDEAHPDAFKKPLWNDNKWSNAEQYVGSYYPDDKNGLDYFDGDNLTGTWNLVYTDQVTGGKGILKSFSLIFCDPPRFCSPCLIPQDFMNARDLGSFCGGDPALNNLRPMVNPSDIKSGFDYLFAVINGKRILDISKNPDLSKLSKGSYDIFALQYRPENISLLSNIKSTADLENLFYGNQSKICGALSKSSSKLTILSDPGVQDEVREVYGRDFVIIDGQRITSDQTILQSFTDQNGCDSIVRTMVQFKDYNPVFTQDHDYDCDHTSIGLSVKSNPEFPIQRWFTPDGKIDNRSEINSNQIIAEAPGTYYVVFKIEDYLDTIKYVLNTDPNSPVITLSNEYILCSSTPLLLTIGSNFEEANIQPSSTATIDGNKLTILDPGLYTITVVKGNCTLVKHILVQPSQGGKTIVIDDAILSCPGNPVELIPSLSQNYENYEWFFQNKKIATTKSLTTDDPGLYSFRAYDQNECGVSGTAWVEDNTSKINLQIKGPDIINCDNQGGNNLLSASFQGNFDATWTLPDGSVVMNSTVPIGQDGNYQVKITDDNGCIITASQNVTTVMEVVDFEVPTKVTIPCKATETTITANVMAPSDEYDINWSGASPGKLKNQATVNNPGTVKVTVTHKVSLCSQTKTILIEDEPGKPELTFDTTLDLAITCDNPVRELPLQINCNNCTPEFTTKGKINLENDLLIAKSSGTVDIFLDNGMCISNRTITFPEDNQAEKLKIEKDNIGCSDKPGRIEINNANSYSSIELQSSKDTFPYSAPITNIRSPVSYTVVYTDKENGCQGKLPIEVIATSEPPAVDYESVHYIQCNTGKAVLAVKGDEVTRLVWFDPDKNQIGENINPLEVDTPGKYRFVAYNKDLCYQDLVIEVKDDQSSPVVNIAPEYFISCDASQSFITPAYDTTKLDFVIWYGPGGWSSTEFFPELGVGDYRAVIVGKNGCETSVKTTVIQQTGGKDPNVVAPPITCLSPFTRVHLNDYTDVAQIQWIDESGQASTSDSFDVYNPGKISLVIKKDNDCLISKNLLVQRDDSTVPFKLNKAVIDCNNLHPQFQVETTGSVNRPVFYQWYFGNTPVGNSAAYDIEYPGDYKVVVNYDNGCIDSLSHTVKLDTTAVEFLLKSDTISCTRSKIQLHKDIVTSQISRASWTGPSGFTSEAIRPSFQTPGTYEVTYMGKNGCIGKSEMEIYGDVIPPRLDSVDYLSLGCGDKEVDLTYFTQDSVTTQYWQLPDGQILDEPLVKIRAKGNYILYLEGGNGCEKIDTFKIEQTVNPKFDIQVQDADCKDHTGYALLLPERDTFTATWIDPATMNEIATGTMSPELPAGSYLVTVINPYNNCDTTTVFEIRDISNILEAEISIDDSLRCERSQANLISEVYPPSENYTYEWTYANQPTPISHDSMAKNISREGIYYLTLTDTVNQCTTQAQFQNKRASSLLRSFDLFLTEPACDLNRAGFAIMDSIIGASNMNLVTYSINGSPFRSQDTFPFLYANEKYAISAKDEYGCRIDTVLMPVLRGVMERISSIQDTTINGGDSLDFNDPAFKISYMSLDAPLSEKYTWILNPDTLSCDYDCVEMIEKQLFRTRTVSAHLTNQYGCALADTFNVYVREGDVLNLPNAIAPGSPDPDNAHACIYANEYIANIDLYAVFNRMGKVIFKKTDFSPLDPNHNFSNCWDGRDARNNILPIGNYNYYVRYKTVYGATKEKYGNIFLIR